MDIHNTIYYQDYCFLQKQGFSAIAIEVALSACERAGCRASHIFHKTDKESYCRKLLMYVLFEYYNYTVTTITQFFNCWPTTVYRAIEQIAEQSKIVTHMELDILALTPKSK